MEAINRQEHPQKVPFLPTEAAIFHVQVAREMRIFVESFAREGPRPGAQALIWENQVQTCQTR